MIDSKLRQVSHDNESIRSCLLHTLHLQHHSTSQRCVGRKIDNSNYWWLIYLPFEVTLIERATTLALGNYDELHQVVPKVGHFWLLSQWPQF